MKRAPVLPLLALAAVLAGCSGGRDGAVKAEAEAAAAPARSTEVVLLAAAQKEAGIEVQPAAERLLPELLRVTGRVALNENRTWRVGAVTEGRIVRVFVNAGDPVKEGQVLARMHSHEIHEARASHKKALTELDRQRDAESHLRTVRDRARRLLELKAGSREALEHAEAGLRSAQSAVAAAGLEVQRTRTHLVEFLQIPAEEPKGHAAGSHDDDEDLIPIRSPAAGTLLERGVTAGTVVQAGGQTFVIADLTTLWALAAVPEEHLARLRIAMPVRVFVHAHGERPFAGRLVRLGEQLDPATRTLQARIELPNAGGLLKPEMYATAEMEIGGFRGLQVLQAAVQDIQGQQSVFVRKSETTFEVRPVETGPSRGGYVRITAGLRPGEQVVTRGAFILKSQLLKSSLAEE